MHKSIARQDSIMAEVPEMLYLYDRPNIIDATTTASALQITPTPVELVLDEMAQSAPAL